MRLAAYAGASTVAAASVIFRAFYERPNFYSATVYLGQSNACRMILLNMLLLSASGSVYGLQRLLYGRLRAFEIEQLWDKAWYAITETALAMTTFRDEVGGWFFVMFMSLLAGKIWGWIGEGRVETLEQQPPANPRLFHIRLTASLFLSELFDISMLLFCLATLRDDPRPGMMVMFAFEFAVLAINSTATAVRYSLILFEKAVVQSQLKLKVEERREELRAARETAQMTQGEGARPIPSSNDIDVDENEIDVPGWQEKGKYILFLDLTIDFLKLVLYTGFFMILLFFSGIPIHMFRDLFVTTRSFLKRISDYLKYRNATRDMNAKYSDATAEELARDGICIICREEMRVWQQPGSGDTLGGNPRATRSVPDERQRPKKLPCGHILHFGCLRSWLERQQVCPTCRRSVLVPDRPQGSNGNNDHTNTPRNRPGDQPVQDQRQNLGTQGNQADRANEQQQNERQNLERNGMRARTFNLGALRLTFATGNPQQFQNFMDQQQQDPRQPPNQDTSRNSTQNQRNSRTRHGVEPSRQRRSYQGVASSTQSQISTLERQITQVERDISQEINTLNVTQNELNTVRHLQHELARLRTLNGSNAQTQTSNPLMPGPSVLPFQPAMFQPNVMATNNQPIGLFASQPHQEPLPSGHRDLPSGVTLPEGWSMIPMQLVSPRERQLSRPHVQTSDRTYNVSSQTALPEAREPRNARSHERIQPSVAMNGSAIQPTSTVPRIRSALGRPATSENAQEQLSTSQTNGDEHTNGLPNWSAGEAGSFALNAAASSQNRDPNQHKTPAAFQASSQNDHAATDKETSSQTDGSTESNKATAPHATVEDENDGESG